MANKFKTYSSMSKGYRRRKDKHIARKERTIEKFEAGVIENADPIVFGRRQILALRTHI